MKRTIVGAIAVVAGFAGMLLGGGNAVAAALSCDATTGSPGAGECQITTVHAVTGAVEVDRTLHIFGTGRIDASGGGITLSICVAPAPAASTCDLILDTPNPLVVPPAIGGGQIEANDVTGNDNASNVTINVSRDILMGPSSQILAENRVSGGHGGVITITTGRNMTMNGLATISVSGSGSSGNSPAGSIAITVGDPVGHTAGIFDMDSTSQVLANSSAASAGSISIVAGSQMDIDGLVQSKSTLSGVSNQPPGGGPITLVSGCKLTVSDTGIVSSEGKDPGSDLVHLEGCDVLVQGVVQSIAPGAGHVLPTNPPNHCNLDTTAHPNGPSSGYSACVEIWGNNVTIDSTGTHNGHVSADGIRNPLRAWVDIFARKNITIISDTTGNYSVSANAATTGPASGAHAGLINIKAQGGTVVAKAAGAGTVGLAIQANGTGSAQSGGDVFVQAGGASGSGQVDFTADSVQAQGTSGKGGSINAQSFNDQVLGLAAGELNALNGAVNLTACVGDPGTTYAGTVTGTRTNSGPGVGCGGTPTFPAVANWFTGQAVGTFFTSHATLCDVTCGPTCTPSGQKFNDLLNNGVKDPSDPGVSGVQIHIFDKATTGSTLHQHQLTDVNGNYSFSVPPGEYLICEQGGPSPFSPAQTFPTSDGSGGLCATHTGITGSRGYDVTLSADVNSCTSTNNDFGNFFGNTVDGQKFNDLNNNGVKDSGEPPVQGTQIHLFDSATGGTNFHQHQLTDASGNFSFTGVPAGDYILCEQGGPAPNSPAQTFPLADGSSGKCATHTGITGSRGYAITLTSNQDSTGNDFGNFFGGTISGKKFNDLNNNGANDSEPGVSGVQIHLFDKLTLGTTYHQHQVTDGSGNYSFTNVPPGEYFLCEQGGPAPNSPAQTFPATDGSGGACATHTSVAGSRGYDIVLTANQTVTSKDFGNFFGGSVSGHKFSDVNGNGIDDDGQVVVGLQIHLFDKATGGTNYHQHQLTDASGNFSFSNVPPDEYILCEQAGFPPETVPATDGSGGACATHTGFQASNGYDIVLAANQVVTGKNFGNAPGIVRDFATISGQKFDDLNSNGAKDSGEPPITGVQIHLFDKATGGTNFHQHQTSDINGNFSFGNLNAGEYILCEQGGPPTQTGPATDGSGGLCATHTGVPNSRGYDITVAAGENSTGNNFGNHTQNIPPPPHEQIPTLDEYALLALAVLLGIMGAVVVRRRQNQAKR